MRRYLLGKVAQAFLTLCFVIAFNFFLFRVVPGDPASLLLRGTAAFNEDNVDQLRHELGLDNRCRRSSSSTCRTPRGSTSASPSTVGVRR